MFQALFRCRNVQIDAISSVVSPTHCLECRDSEHVLVLKHGQHKSFSYQSHEPCRLGYRNSMRYEHPKGFGPTKHGSEGPIVRI